MGYALLLYSLVADDASGAWVEQIRHMSQSHVSI
jgi:hypothetical protein